MLLSMDNQSSYSLDIYIVYDIMICSTAWIINRLYKISIKRTHMDYT